MIFQTRVSKLLEIEYPIFLGGMAWAGSVELAASVSNNGGLGILGSGSMSADELQSQIHRIKTLTNQPFGVNLYYLNKDIERQKKVILEEKPPVITIGAGNPGKDIPIFKEKNIKVIPVVSTVAIARRLERLGADMLIAEGTEAGGHVGDITTMTLVPQIVDYVNIPVIAAGGIADGRGFAAALALGAEGIQMGTRFLASVEATIHKKYKDAIIKAKDRDTVITGFENIIKVRSLKNKLTNKFIELSRNGATLEELETIGMGALKKAVLFGDTDMGSVMMGQSSGLIKEILPVKKIIENTIAEMTENVLKL